MESTIKELQIEDVERFLQMLLRFLVPQLNSNLRDGIPLPRLGPFFSLQESRLALQERYIRLDMSPVPATGKVSQVIRAVIEGLLADGDMVAA